MFGCCTISTFSDALITEWHLDLVSTMEMISGTSVIVIVLVRA